MEEWKNVIWTDEASFELGKNSRQVRVWRKCDEAYNEDCLAPTFKSARMSVMVWGAIALGKKSELVIMDADKRTAQNFVDQVYDGPLQRFLDEVDDAVLMEDGAPIHRSKTAKKWRDENGVEKMIWPAQSPDMNPIENLWKIMKNIVQSKFQPGMSRKDFEQVIKDAWDSIKIEKVDGLIETMPTRIKTLKQKKGKSTRY
jgi:hypothetical protein